MGERGAVAPTSAALMHISVIWTLMCMTVGCEVPWRPNERHGVSHPAPYKPAAHERPPRPGRSRHSGPQRAAPPSVPPVLEPAFHGHGRRQQRRGLGGVVLVADEREVQ